VARAKAASSEQGEEMSDPCSGGARDARDSALEEGKVFDYITGNPVKDTDKERVRQRIARAIIHEYGIAAEDMEPDYG
jgi:type I restriction enzyme M protein